MAGPASRTFKSYPTRIEVKPGDKKEFTIDMNIPLNDQETVDGEVAFLYYTATFKTWMPGGGKVIEDAAIAKDGFIDRPNGIIRVRVTVPGDAPSGSWYGEIEFKNKNGDIIDHSQTFNFEILPSI